MAMTIPLTTLSKKPMAPYTKAPDFCRENTQRTLVPIMRSWSRSVWNRGVVMVAVFLSSFFFFACGSHVRDVTTWHECMRSSYSVLLPFTLSCPISCAIMDNDVINITEPPLPINTAVAYTAFRPSSGWTLNQKLALTAMMAPRQNVIWEEMTDMKAVLFC